MAHSEGFEHSIARFVAKPLTISMRTEVAASH